MLKHAGEEKVVKTTGEIILAAGTVGTTKLLLLSGVGPKAHLQELKVSLGLTNHLSIFVVPVLDFFLQFVLSLNCLPGRVQAYITRKSCC